MAKKEEIETKVAVEAVNEAEAKVEKIKAEKLAKKAERQNKRLEWKHFKWVGKSINWVENNPVGAAVSVLTGTGIGYGIAKGIEIYKSKKSTAELPEETTSDEAEEAPFEEA